MRLLLDKEKHYFIVRTQGDKFFLGDGRKFLNENGGTVVFSGWKKVEFYLENSYLRCKNKYVAWCYGNDNKLIMFLQNFITSRSIIAKPDPFDINYFASGSYAFVYHPSISMGDEYVTRISLNRRSHVSIPTEFHSKFEQFCLLPISTQTSLNIVIEEYKKCDTDIKSYVDANSLKFFLEKLRNLFVGLQTFREVNFFHGDIEMRNIVIDNGEFKFIDYDLSFFLDNPKRSFLILGWIFPNYPLIPAVLASKYLQKKYSDDFSFEIRDDDSGFNRFEFYRKRVNFCGIHNILCENITKFELYKYIDEFSMNDLEFSDFSIYENIIHYISIYQLAIVIIEIISAYCINFEISDNNRDLLHSFILYCVDFRTNGFVKIDDVLEKYDELLVKLN